MFCPLCGLKEKLQYLKAEVSFCVKQAKVSFHCHKCHISFEVTSHWNSGKEKIYQDLKENKMTLD